MNRKKRVFCWIAVWCMLLTAFPMQGAAADAANGAEPETEEESLTQVPMNILRRMAESNCEQNPAKYDNDGAASWAFNENSSNWWHTRYDDDGVDDSRELTKSEWTAIKSDYAENGFREDAEYAYIGSGFGRTINLKKIECKMRNEGYAICDYRLLTSLDGKSYTPVVLNQDGAANGTIATLQYENNAGIIELPQPVAAKYFRIEVLSVGSSNDAAVRDIKVFGYPYSEELKPRLKIDLSDYSMTYREDEKKELADLAENPADLAVWDAGYYFNTDNLPEFTFGNESAAFTAKSVDENGVLHVSYTLTSAQAEAYRAYKAQELAKELAGTLAAVKAELQQIKPSPKFPAAERDALIQRIDTFETTTAGMTIGAKKREFDKLKADCDNFRKGKRVPVLKVSFEDNVTDSSGFDNNGTAIGEPEYVEGVMGKALHIVNEGNEPSAVAAQYVNFGKGEELQFGTGNFTVGLWYKSSVREASGGWHSAVISNKDWSTGDNFGFNMGHMNQSGDRGWGINWNFNTKKDDAAEGGRVETGRYAQPTDGAWHYLTGVVDRSSQEIRFYIDGEFKERQSTAGKFGTADTGYDLVLGADGYEHRYGTKDGCFDELVIYQEALPEEMIYELASDGRRSYEIGRMEQIIAKAEPGARFPAASIAAIQKKVADTKAQLEASDNETEKETLFEALTADYEAFLTGDPLVSFHLISDIHTNGKDSENGRNFKTGLINMKEMNPQADALISCGDNTEYGQEWEVKDFFDLIKENNPVAEKNGKIMVTMGNHDVRGENSGNNWVTSPTTANHGWWSNAYSYYMQNNKDFMPDMPDELTGEEKTYFDYWINGYHFIVLNEENSPKDQASVTEDQLIWLEEKLGESENADNPFDAEKPVFVFIHQALEDTHQHSGLYLGFGPADARMKEILSRYPQTVLCTGHIHNGFGTAEVIERSYGTMADVPSFKETEAWNDSREKGSGYEVYVYEDEIVFRAADFLKGEWLPEYDYSVKRTTLPVLVKKADNLREKDYTIQSWKAVSADLQIELAKAKVLMNKRYPLNVRAGEVKPDSFLYHQDTRTEIKTVQKNLSRLLDQLELSTDPTTEMQKEIDRLEKEKADAELAKDKAEQDLKDAQEDPEAANTAKDSAESAKTEADEAKAKAEADMAEAQKAEKEAKEALQKAKEAEAAAKAALETAKKNLEAAQKNAGGKKIGRPALVSVKPGKSGALKITWNKLQDVSGLEIQYGTNGKFKNAAVKKISASKTSCTLKKLRKGKKYHVRIRGYRNDGDNTVYSAYSAKKSAKVKK